MNSRNPWVGMLLIVSVGGALGLGYNALQPRALPWIAHPKPVVALDSLTQSSSELPANQAQPSEQVNENVSTQVSKTTPPRAIPPLPIEPRPLQAGLAAGDGKCHGDIPE
jgi:hypothetical protein